jgi:hypothetical protein
MLRTSGSGSPKVICPTVAFLLLRFPAGRSPGPTSVPVRPSASGSPSLGSGRFASLNADGVSVRGLTHRTLLRVLLPTIGVFSDGDAFRVLALGSRDRGQHEATAVIPCGPSPEQVGGDNSGQSPVARLRMRNLANVEAGVLLLALKRVDFVYSRAGIQTHWQMLEDGTVPLFDVVILDADVTDAVTDNPRIDVMGSADRSAHRAQAYYDRIRDAAVKFRAPAWSVLGDVIAHEIGHLLLPHNSHSARGVMRPDLQRGGLAPTFESAEAQTMRGRIRTGAVGDAARLGSRNGASANPRSCV